MKKIDTLLLTISEKIADDSLNLPELKILFEELWQDLNLEMYQLENKNAMIKLDLKRLYQQHFQNDHIILDDFNVGEIFLKLVNLHTQILQAREIASH